MTSSLRPLRPHQQRAIDGLKSALLDGYRRPLLQAPTGAGKTVIASHVVVGARGKGKRVAFCVPALSLVDQSFERFVENGIDASEIGVMQGDHPWRRPHAPIQIATAQTLSRRELPEVDVVIIDECHIRHSVYEAWMAECPSKVFIGLTATPWARGLGRMFDKLVKPTSLSELIDLGYLSKFRVFAPSHPDLRGVRTVAGDYHEGELADRMNQPELVADIVTTWLARGEDRSTLCFATGRAHAQALRDRFADAGVPVAYVDANTPRDERDAIGRDLAAGKVKVVVNIGCLTTGIDWDVRCLILARPTKSESLFVQIIGRALRIADGKQDAIILDHSDTHLRLGMVTDIDYDDLDTGAKEAKSSRTSVERVPLPKECPSCTCLIPAAVRECPTCGFEPKPVLPEEASGDLVELGKTGRKQPSVREVIKQLGKREVFAQLNVIRHERGRSPGWAAHAYREIFGTWPRNLGYQSAEPSALLRSWLRSRDIAYAKSNRRDGAQA